MKLSLKTFNLLGLLVTILFFSACGSSNKNRQESETENQPLVKASRF